MCLKELLRVFLLCVISSRALFETIVLINLYSMLLWSWCSDLHWQARCATHGKTQRYAHPTKNALTCIWIYYAFSIELLAHVMIRLPTHIAFVNNLIQTLRTRNLIAQKEVHQLLMRERSTEDIRQEDRVCSILGLRNVYKLHLQWLHLHQHTHMHVCLSDSKY